METLLKLNQVKGGQQTLLHFLIQHSEKVQDHCLEFMEAMPHVEAASRLAMGVIQTQVKAVQTGLSLIVSELELASTEGDAYASVMQAWRAEMEPVAQSLIAQWETLQKEARELVIFFGMDAGTVSLEQFLSIFVEFNVQIQRARMENTVSTSPHTSSQNVTSPNTTSRTSPPVKRMPKEMMEKGDLENAIASMRNGAALRRVKKAGGDLKVELSQASEAIVRLQQQRKQLDERQ